MAPCPAWRSAQVWQNPGMEAFAQFTVEGQRVYGMLHVPDGDVPAQGWPSVVMLHGFTGHRMEGHRNFVLLSRLLARQGVASLRFDFRGSGERARRFPRCPPTFPASP